MKFVVFIASCFMFISLMQAVAATSATTISHCVGHKTINKNGINHTHMHIGTSRLSEEVAVVSSVYNL